MEKYQQQKESEMTQSAQTTASVSDSPETTQPRSSVIDDSFAVTVTSEKKKVSPIALIAVVVLFIAIGLGSYVYKDTLSLMIKGGTVGTPTPTPVRNLTLIKSTIPLTAEIGKDFHFQVRVLETLIAPAYSVEGLSGAIISTTGLVTWTPSTEGIITGKVKITDPGAEGVIDLVITVSKPTDAISDRYTIPESFVVPEYPVFYLSRVKGISQLWVMNKDGSDQKYTGVDYINGSIENAPNFGGVLYAVDDARQVNTQKKMQVYYYSAQTRKTIIIKHQGSAPKGRIPSMYTPIMAPSGAYIVYVYSLTNPEEIGDETREYWVYEMASATAKKLTEMPTYGIAWGIVPNTIQLASDKGIYSYHIWNGTKSLLTDQVGSIPGEHEFTQIAAGVSLNLLGDPDTKTELILMKGSESSIVDTSTWAELQPFFCVSPDKKRVLYEYSIHREQYSYPTVKILDLETEKTRWLTTQTPKTEGYVINGCVWTSSTTVIIEKLENGYDNDASIYLIELNIETGAEKLLTPAGRNTLTIY